MTYEDFVAAPAETKFLAALQSAGSVLSAMALTPLSREEIEAVQPLDDPAQQATVIHITEAAQETVLQAGISEQDIVAAVEQSDDFSLRMIGEGADDQVFVKTISVREHQVFIGLSRRSEQNHVWVLLVYEPKNVRLADAVAQFPSGKLLTEDAAIGIPIAAFFNNGFSQD